MIFFIVLFVCYTALVIMITVGVCSYMEFKGVEHDDKTLRTRPSLYDVEDIATYMLEYLYYDCDHSMMNILHLQNMLFVAQGVFLSRYNEPLFYEDFVNNGGVVEIPLLKDKYKHLAGLSILDFKSYSYRTFLKDMNGEQRELLRRIADCMVFSSFLAFSTRFQKSEECRKTLSEESNPQKIPKDFIRSWVEDNFTVNDSF